MPLFPKSRCTTHYRISGGPVSLKTIELDGKPFEVQENLCSARGILAPVDGTSTLWVDAICINQDDTDERNYQVTQMGAIYRSAMQVDVWLAKWDTDCAAFFDL